LISFGDATKKYILISVKFFCFSGKNIIILLKISQNKFI